MKALFYRAWHWWRDLSGLHRVTVALETFGFVVVAAYTTVAFCQLHQMIKATLATERAASAATESAKAVARQVADEEIVERASVVFFSTRIENFPRKPLLKFTLKNVGQTTATEITFGPMMGSQGWLKTFTKNPVAALGPGERSPIDNILPFEEPGKAGFALAQGQTRDIEWPLRDVGATVIAATKGKHIKLPFNQTTFKDVANGLAYCYYQFYITYLDASNKVRGTSDCLAYSETKFVPCWGGQVQK